MVDISRRICTRRLQREVENEEVDINILNRKQRLAYNSYNILEEYFNKKKMKEGIKLM